MRVDIQHAYEYGLYLQHPLVFAHSHYHKFESEEHDISASNLLLKHVNGILLPKLYDNSDYLLYENFCDR